MLLLCYQIYSGSLVSISRLWSALQCDQCIKIHVYFNISEHRLGGSSEHTWSVQWAALVIAPGEHLRFRHLTQGHSCHDLLTLTTSRFWAQFFNNQATTAPALKWASKNEVILILFLFMEIISKKWKIYMEIKKNISSHVFLYPMPFLVLLSWFGIYTIMCCFVHLRCYGSTQPDQWKVRHSVLLC